MVGPEAYYTLKEFDTLPRILHSEGYVCGLSGKWHLGANMTPQDGFSYWITMVRGSTRSFYDIWKGGRSKARRRLAPVGHPDYRPLRKQ